MNSASNTTLKLEAAAVILVAVVLFGIWNATALDQPKTFAEAAVGTGTIDISGCVPSPKVSKFTHDVPVTFVNRDNEAHEIFFSPDMNFTVPANGKKGQSFSAWKEPGVRKYDCDGQKGAGQIYITG